MSAAYTAGLCQEAICQEAICQEEDPAGDAPPETEFSCLEAGISYPGAFPQTVRAEAFAPQGEWKGQERSGEHYQEQLTRLEAELEQERAHAQEMSVKWGSERARRRRETQNRKLPTRPTIQAPVHAASQPAKKPARSALAPVASQERARNYLPLLVVGISLLLAGICSVLALHLDWSLGH